MRRHMDNGKKALGDGALATVATPVTGKLRRRHVADMLGTSVASVRRMEGSVLHPQRGPRGVHLFDATEVETVVRSRSRTLTARAPEVDGDLAADIFTLLDDGATARQVVVRLRVAPEVVERTYAAWIRLDGGLVVAPDARAKLRDMGVDAADGDELVARVRELAEPAKCGRCRKQPAAICPKCAKRRSADLT